MFKKISLVALMAVVFANCDIKETNSSSCPVIIGVSTTAVTGPVEAAVNETVNLEVSYKTKASCGSFSSFYKNPSVEPLIDIITVNTVYDACACDEVESIKTQNYAFKKSAAGVYIVKFKKTNEDFIEHTITVQ